MNAKLIDLKDWVPFGGGGFGDSFYHKTDDSVVLKLNKASVPAQRALMEFQRSKAVYEMGIPSAQPFDYVTDGKRYGMTMERIRGKESFGRIIADNPHRLEELVTMDKIIRPAYRSVAEDRSYITMEER